MADQSSAPRSDPRLQRRRPGDKELDRESEITDLDVDDAVAAWKRDAPVEARGILDAEVSE